MQKFFKDNFKALVFMLFGALAMLLLVKGCNCTKTPTAPIVTPTKEIKQEAKKVEWNYKKSTDSLEQIANRLRTDSAKSHSQLIAITGKTRKLEQLLISIKPAPCDTAAINQQYQNTLDYIADVNTGDSLCNETIQVLGRQIDIEREKAKAEGLRATTTGQLLQEALANADAQQKYGSDLKRKLRWSKIGNKIWKGAAVAATAYIIISIIK